jgi:hypothetical protein
MRKSKFVLISVVLIAGATGLQIAQAGNSNGDIAFTNWAFVFNHPEFCDGPCNGPDLGNPDVGGAVMYLTGQRVQSNGRAIFAGAISANSSYRQIDGSSPMGITNPQGAEIHIGLQRHTEDSLDGDATARHMQVTNPCGPPCSIVQVAVFMPYVSGGAVRHTSDDSPVKDSAATITRSDDGVTISIDTRL